MKQTMVYHASIKDFLLLKKANDGEIIGVLLGCTAFAEIHVDDICVKFGYRHKGLGARLLQEVEDRFISKGYNNINLVTSEFQATEFYKKCGFEVEFIRKNKQNPKLTKTFFIKYIDDIKSKSN